MKKLNNNELKLVDGGSISGAIVTAFKGIFNTFADLGRSLGSGIRRIQTKSYCSCN